jgi:hypothetical protein
VGPDPAVGDEDTSGLHHVFILCLWCVAYSSRGLIFEPVAPARKTITLASMYFEHILISRRRHVNTVGASSVGRVLADENQVKLTVMTTAFGYRTTKEQFPRCCEDMFTIYTEWPIIRIH